jgi:hypothetical protein
MKPSTLTTSNAIEPTFMAALTELDSRRTTMNHDKVTINWQFTCKKARQKFGYNRNNITR